LPAGGEREWFKYTVLGLPKEVKPSVVKSKDEGFVYFLKLTNAAGEDSFKIGKASCLKKRLNKYEADAAISGSKITLIHDTWCSAYCRKAYNKRASVRTRYSVDNK
jgi:hypothetical protein